MKYKLEVNEKSCIGCYSCLVSCIAAHHDVSEEDAKPYLRIKTIRNIEENFQKNVPEACSHCGSCVKVCPDNALYRDAGSGFVLYKKSLCKGCGLCRKACPHQVILYDINGRVEKCDGCIERIKKGEEPACVRNCCLKAIRMVKIED